MRTETDRVCVDEMWVRTDQPMTRTERRDLAQFLDNLAGRIDKSWAGPHADDCRRLAEHLRTT